MPVYQISGGNHKELKEYLPQGEGTNGPEWDEGFFFIICAFELFIFLNIYIHVFP